MGSRSYKDLFVWQKSMELVTVVYTLTKQLPEEEKFGLTSQMRRCAISIPSNIAEGSKRGTHNDFRQFLRIAYGSGAELETQFEITRKLRLIPKDSLRNAENLLSEIMKILNTMLSRDASTKNYKLPTTNS